MLLELPQDLLICMLSEWLAVGLKDLSQLDVAIGWGGSATQHWLALLADLRLGTCKLPLSIHSCLTWMHARRLQVTGIVVQMAVVNSLDGQALPFAFASITALVFDSHSFARSPFGLKELLIMLPNVSSIDFTECAVDEQHLLELLDLPLPRLKELNLHWAVVGNMTSAAVAAVAKHFSATLEVLRCDVLDDYAVRKLATSCRALTAIEWSVHGLKSAQYLLELCAHNAQLAIVKLWSCHGYSSEIMTNAFVISLSLACPLLQEIWLDSADPVEYLVLPALFANCKLLHTAVFGDARLSLHRCGDGTRVCDVFCAICDLQVEHSTDLLVALTLPVRRFGWMEAEDDPEELFECVLDKELPVNRQALCLLVEHARTLEDIRIDITVDVVPEDLQQLLRSCANPHGAETLGFQVQDNLGRSRCPAPSVTVSKARCSGVAMLCDACLQSSGHRCAAGLPQQCHDLPDVHWLPGAR